MRLTRRSPGAVGLGCVSPDGAKCPLCPPHGSGMGAGRGAHSFCTALEADEVIWGGSGPKAGWLCAVGEEGVGETTGVRSLVGVDLAEFNAAITVRLFIRIKH